MAPSGDAPHRNSGPETRPDDGRSIEEQSDDGRSFEELVDELETVTEALAGGQIGIEAAADLYERAERLHRLARARLDAVQERVDRLAGDAEPGGGPAPGR